MERHIQYDRERVNDWQHQEIQQEVLSIAIGILGLIVGALQARSANWAKVLTVILGLSVSAITIFTKTIYTADFQTLRRAVAQADPILQNLQDFPDKYGSANPTDELTLEAQFKSEEDKITEISNKVLGINDQGSIKEDPAKPQHVLLIDTPEAVYAQQDSGQNPPSWTASPPFSTNGGSYFVGVGRDSSLTKARDLSLNSAYYSASSWIQASSSTQGSPSPQLISLVQDASQVVQTWFSVEKTTGVWSFYSQIRIPTTFQSLGVSPAASVTTINTTVDIPNDSAVYQDGLTFVLRHMGFAPLSATLFVLAPQNGTGPAVPLYTENKDKSHSDTEKFEHLVGSCDGRHVPMNANVLWCFSIQSSHISPKHDKRQYLGSVKADGAAIDLAVVKFDDNARSLKVSLSSGH